MKKLIVLSALLLLSFTLFGQWIVGQPIGQDYDWTDDSGEYHSIYELIDNDIAVVIFWGEDW